jgi:polyisoprenoid-binding protein YceI
MKYLALTALLICPFSTAVDWQSDPSKSELTYAVNFEQLPLNGQFKEFVVDYSHQQQLRVVVNISSVDMGNSDINEAIRDSDWFDIRQHSQAEFFSDTINTIGEDQFTAQGMLQLKGISKPVTVPFSWNPADAKPNCATMVGKLTLNRSDFAIGSQEWASGDQIGIDVTVSFDVQMLQHAPK